MYVPLLSALIDGLSAEGVSALDEHARFRLLLDYGAIDLDKKINRKFGHTTT